MKQHSDQVLIEELMVRFKAYQKNIEELKSLNMELGQVNKKLSESEKLKSHFLSNVRNEIINPLSSILNLSGNMAEAESMPAKEVRKLASIIFNEAYTLNFQLKNIFVSAEIEAGQLTRDIYEVNIHKLINGVIADYSSMAAIKNILIQYTPDDENSEAAKKFKTDPGKLNIVVTNLLVNAISNSNKGSTVEIFSKIKDNTLSVSINDFGKGIEEKDHEVIFDRFTQLDPVIHTSNSGHGLGLSIVKAIMDFMDGQVNLHSELGKGSTFTLMVPQTGDDQIIEGFAEGGQEFIFDDGEIF